MSRIPLLTRAVCCLLGGVFFLAGGVHSAPRVFTASDAPRFGVMPFKDTTQAAKDEKYGEAVAAMLTTELMRERNIRVVEKEELVRILEEQRFSLSGLTDRYLEAGKLAGMDVAIVGAVSVLGDPTVVQYPPAMAVRRVESRSLEVDIRAVNLVTGEIIRSWSFSTRDASKELRGLLREIAHVIAANYLRPMVGFISVDIDTDTAVYYRVAAGSPDQIIPPAGEIPLHTFHALRVAAQSAAGQIASTAALLSEPLLQGEYDVLAVKPGYAPQHARLTVAAGQTARWKPVFAPALSVLTLTELPAQADIILIGGSPWNAHLRLRVRTDRRGNALVSSLDDAAGTPSTGIPVRVTVSTAGRSLTISDVPTGAYECRAAVYNTGGAGVRRFSAAGNVRTVSVPRWPIAVPLGTTVASGARVRVFVRPESGSAAVPDCELHLDNTYIGILGDPGEAEIIGVSEGPHQLSLVPVRSPSTGARSVSFNVPSGRRIVAVYVE